MNPITKELKDNVQQRAKGVKFSVKYIAKGSMKGTFILGCVKDRITRTYLPFNEQEQKMLIKALQAAGYVYYNGDNFQKENWFYFNGGFSVCIKKGS